MFRRLCPVLLVLVGCAPSAPLGVVSSAELSEITDSFVRTIAIDGMVRSKDAKIVFDVALDSGLCGDCYRLKKDGATVQVRGGGKLGAQYGLAHAFESLGVRFFHPWHTYVPAKLELPATLPTDEFKPETARRGLHLHTLHPIESLYDFWVPEEKDALDGAHRTLDWVIKNRGNYVQWLALDDIMDDARLAKVKPHQKAIVDYAHLRGLKVGIGIQLFGSGNLQNAYDLIDGHPTGDVKPVLRERYKRILDGVGWDTLSLSFGEFNAGADAAKFIAQVNEAYDVLQEVQPGMEMINTIHVGNFPDLQVEYMGQKYLYYFLVQFVKPEITRWVHTVMYYNLFEDAGQAYLHDDFPDHRKYVLDRVQKGEKVGYHPESAYWIAFDNNVPQYLPLYSRSRHLDLKEIKARAGKPLQDHVLFSTGWEWSYWQTDIATLRYNYKLPERWEEDIEFQFAPFGERGVEMAKITKELGELQHQYLLLKRLTAYLAGRDQIIDAGENLGLYSQPDRFEYDQVAKMSAADRAKFNTDVVVPLGEYADKVTALAARTKDFDAEDKWQGEFKDSLEITASRARFQYALYRATLAYIDTGSPADWLDKSEAELNVGRGIVGRRRTRLHDPDPKPILRNHDNPTFYDYGYLREGDTLCFWVRERAQARNLILQSGIAVPGCVLVSD